jgi:thiamine-phosphate pyrophosphorylase
MENEERRMRLRGLYAITPEDVSGEALLEKVRCALEGGIALLQYRRKSGTPEERRAEARAVLALARGHGVPLIVNDDVGLARATGAEGAHLGRDDGDVRAARAVMRQGLLGVSCYDRLELARAAAAAGADYVAFGAVFASSTKPAAVRAPLSLFREARSLGVPLAAIGGITLENAPQAIAAGADLLAVISDLFDAPDISARARAYQRLFS